jgi:hypothetical protein
VSSFIIPRLEGLSLSTPKIFSKTFAKPLDKKPQMWYNVNVKRGDEEKWKSQFQ